MNAPDNIALIRCGKFTVTVGFLQLPDARLILDSPVPKAKNFAQSHMPIIAIGWVGSDYPPFFHSLN